MNVTFEDREITIGTKTLELECPIKKIIPLRDQILILFRTEEYGKDDSRYQQNVVGLDYEGREVWRIRKSTVERPGPDGKMRRSPFVGIGYGSNDTIIVVYDYLGTCYELDPATGDISNPQFSK